MKRFILFLLCISSLVIPVKAHPGKTDGSGGHWDHSTGDYHYHHGYPPHDHYGMDGDGDIDCPYDFDDQTRNNSGSSSTDSVAGIVTSKKVKKVPPIIYWIIGALCVTVFLLTNKCINQRDEIIYQKGQSQRDLKKLQAEHEEQISEIQRKNSIAMIQVKAKYSQIILDCKVSKAELERLTAEIASKQDELTDIQSKLNLLREVSFRELTQFQELKAQKFMLENAPPDVSFAPNGLPVWRKRDSSKPYGDYTVYCSPKSEIYHTDWRCASYSAKRYHIFEVIAFARPCKKCATGFFPFDRIPEWYTQRPEIVDFGIVEENDQLDFQSLSTTIPE